MKDIFPVEKNLERQYIFPEEKEQKERGYNAWRAEA